MTTGTLRQLFLALILLASATRAGEEVDRLLSDYEKIETVTCQIRRTKAGPAGKMQFLSRVYYTRKHQLHAQGITPVKRRTIADGERLWQYVEGDPKGFSRPISELTEPMAISLKMVPGTAMDHLLRLRGRTEHALRARDADRRRIGVQAERNYVELRLDAAGRLVGIRFFKTEAMNDLTAEYTYDDFKEVVPGAWIPMSHAATIHGQEAPFTETVKVDRFVANKPVPNAFFVPDNFFEKSIDFVDDFAKIYEE